MSSHQPFQIIGYHSCDIDVGFRILNGEDEFIHSENSWDWLGPGVYFWEQNPMRALEYAKEVAEGNQFNNGPIKTPFVIGAIIQLGNCLNLVEAESIKILVEAYEGLKILYEKAGRKMPKNEGNNRKLDCAVIKYIHQTIVDSKGLPFDSVRSSFDEGDEAYPGASFTKKNHIQVCVINQKLIQGYFLPRPVDKFNPNFRAK